MDNNDTLCYKRIYSSLKIQMTITICLLYPWALDNIKFYITSLEWSTLLTVSFEICVDFA